jgi:glutamate racemase
VIGTEGTIASGVYQRKLEARGFRVWVQACPALVVAVEEGSEDAQIMVRHYLREMPRVDTLVLGCTHFSVVRDVVERVVGRRVRVVDGAEEVAERVAAEVEDEGSGRVQYYVTGDPEAFAHRIARLSHLEDIFCLRARKFLLLSTSALGKSAKTAR